MNGLPAFAPPLVPAGIISQIDWPPVPTARAAAFLAMLFQLEQSQWLPAEELARRQLAQAGRLLQHAFDTVPHYREKYRDWEGGRLDWARWRELPMLQRAELQSHGAALRSTREPPGHGNVRRYGSSGSSGQPVNVLGNDTTHFFSLVLGLRDHVWHRRDVMLKHGAIRSKVERTRATGWGEWADSLHCGPAAMLNIGSDLATQLDWLFDERPAYLLTHPSNLQALLEYARSAGRTPDFLREVRTFGEMLKPGLREAVKAHWNVRLSDLYSAEELGPIALQCPQHEHYHVQAENLLVEILREDGTPCQPGETGSVVVSTLHNFTMPLIRYRLHDHAVAGEPCPCGRGLPVLSRIAGRSRNMLHLPDGRSHWPSFPGAAFTALAPVQQFQLAQTALDTIEARLVCPRPLTADEEAALQAMLGQQLGYPFRIDFRYLTHINPGPNHKFEDFISLLSMSHPAR